MNFNSRVELNELTAVFSFRDLLWCQSAGSLLSVRDSATILQPELQTKGKTLSCSFTVKV